MPQPPLPPPQKMPDIRLVQPQLSWGTVSPASRKHQIQQLSALALTLRSQKLPGVRLWRELTRMAVAAYTDTGLPPARQADFAMQDLAVVILGPYALKYMHWFASITPHPVQDPLLQAFFSDLGQLGLPPAEPVPAWREAGYAGKINDLFDPGLDRCFGRDFRPQLNDLSDNQVFHTFFYQYIAYVTRATLTIRAASLYHELFERGGTIQDHTAALIGIQMGYVLRQLRESEDPQLLLWPDLVEAAYAAEPTTQLAPAARQLRHQLDTLLHQPRPLDATLRQLEFGLILSLKPPGQ